MVTEAPKPIRLSQAHLQLLETCPPQFQRTYLEQLRGPISAQQHQASQWGNRFHLGMQQRALGLPTTALFTTEPQLGQAIHALEQALPQSIQAIENTWQAAEHARSLLWGNYLLTTVYDYIIADDTHAQIYDWKTYQQPRNPESLANHWQTRLYLYVLAETSDYAPEHLTMTYWFVPLSRSPQHVTLSYSQTKHQQTQQALSQLLEKVESWLNPQADPEQTFPHRPDCDANCPYARYWRSPQSDSSNSDTTDALPWLDALEQLPEVQF